MMKKKQSYNHILLTVFIGLLWVLFNQSGIIVWIKLNHQQRQVENELVSLQKQEKTSVEHIEKLENDINYIEFIAYSKYKMVKSGEKIFRIKNRKKINNP